MAALRLFTQTTEMTEWKRQNPKDDEFVTVFYVGNPIRNWDERSNSSDPAIWYRLYIEKHEVRSSAIKNEEVFVFTNSNEAHEHARNLTIHRGLIEKYGRKLFQYTHAVFSVAVSKAILRQALKREIVINTHNTACVYIIDASDIINTNASACVFIGFHKAFVRFYFNSRSNNDEIYEDIKKKFAALPNWRFTNNLINELINKFSKSIYPAIHELIQILKQDSNFTIKIVFLLLQNTLRTLPKEARMEQNYLQIACDCLNDIFNSIASSGDKKLALEYNEKELMILILIMKIFSLIKLSKLQHLRVYIREN
jgi:hypothetical protein